MSSSFSMKHTDKEMIRRAPPLIRVMMISFVFIATIVSLGFSNYGSYCEALSLPLSNNKNSNIKLKLSPLIGGPSWLPIHVKVVLDDAYAVDFVPLDATSTSTLTKLVTLQNVPAQARFLPVKTPQQQIEPKGLNSRPFDDDNTVTVTTTTTTTRAAAKDFCDTYNKDLHLITNNCWTFAYEVMKHIDQETATTTTTETTT